MNIKKLREIAEAATPNWKFPSRWHGKFGIDARPRNDEEFVLLTMNSNMPNCANDVEFSATFNPETVLRLLDTIERYKKALEFYANPGSWESNTSYFDEDSKILIEGSDTGRMLLFGFEDTVVVGGARAREALQKEEEEE